MKYFLPILNLLQFQLHLSITFNSNDMDIGRKLKTLRTSRGYEVVTFAEKLGISDTTYRRYERNETTPDFHMLEKIAIALDVELNEIFKDDNFTFYNSKNKGENIGNVVHNYAPEKVIELLEKRITDKDDVIATLKAKIVLLKKENAELMSDIDKLKSS
jgi:transcriptional regulator with XRE-family HTH domain